MDEIIKDIQILRPDATPELLKLLINKAIVQIKFYLNKDISDNDIINKYKYALEQIVIDTIVFQNSMQFKNNAKSFSQGSSSVTFNNRVIMSDEVKSMLPTPFVRLV